MDSNHTIHKHEKCAGREGFEKGVEARTGMQLESQEGAPLFLVHLLWEIRESPFFPFIYSPSVPRTWPQRGCEMDSARVLQRQAEGHSGAAEEGLWRTRSDIGLPGTRLWLCS